MRFEELNESLWEWAGAVANDKARKHTWGGDYTLEEKENGVENVRTGLKRKLKVDPEDSSEEEDEDEEADPDAMEIVGVHRRESVSGVEFEVGRGTVDRAVGKLTQPMAINDHLKFLLTGQNLRA